MLWGGGGAALIVLSTSCYLPLPWQVCARGSRRLQTWVWPPGSWWAAGAHATDCPGKWSLSAGTTVSSCYRWDTAQHCSSTRYTVTVSLLIPCKDNMTQKNPTPIKEIVWNIWHRALFTPEPDCRCLVETVFTNVHSFLLVGEFADARLVLASSHFEGLVCQLNCEVISDQEV